MYTTTNNETQEEIDSWIASLSEEERSSLMPTPKSDSHTTPITTSPSSFQRKQAEALETYMQRAAQPSRLQGSFLMLLNDAKNNAPNSSQEENLTPLLCPEYSQSSLQSLFVRANGKGIVINPGPQFLSLFHARGLHIRDIDSVIITSDNPNDRADVKALYDLNHKCNSLSSDLHIIHYYIHQNTYRSLANLLKPAFKQERGMVHPLELYLDSPDVESIELGNGIVLHYFNAAPSSPNEASFSEQIDLGIRLDLPLSSNRTTSIGWLSHAPWDTSAGLKLGQCDLLIAAMTEYEGIASLVRETAPQVVLGAQIDSRCGDMRLELCRKMRQELASHHQTETTLLPLDAGLQFFLDSLQGVCTSCQDHAPTSELHVAKLGPAFGKLHYLCPHCTL